MSHGRPVTDGERVRVVLPGGYGGHMEGTVYRLRGDGAVEVDLGYGLGCYLFDPWDVEPCNPAPPAPARAGGDLPGPVPARLRGDAYPVPKPRGAGGSPT